MSLTDLVGAGLEAPVAAIRRYSISFAIAATAAIGSLCYLASAATRVLELLAGPIGARLIIGVALALIAIGGYVAPKGRAAPSACADRAARSRACRQKPTP